VDVGSNSQYWGQVIWQWQCSEFDNQKFKLEPDGAGYYHIKPKHDDLCFDIIGAVADNTAVLWQWGCHDGDNQKFQLVI
jgi:hypothetical protein